MEAHFTPAEEAVIVRALAGDARPLRCPRCGAPLSRSEVPPRAGVPYVRHRVWVVCGGCGRSLVIDRREVARGDPQST